ncbi:ferredoxin [Thermincola ferriacetica]|uniref:Ferredoxin n=1 Tax=Thermincola ferriacetica TaxID=281456 RepID=A0A0L6W131_9FIRM|nr:ASKHA domain-containing protein [Thermincola ferriacetica]KNZ68784.1 ferredoxin [Thermincola ferriacetica]
MAVNKNLYEITFHPLKLSVKIPAGISVLEAALQNNIPLEGPCNGKGTCGKCRVRYKGRLSAPTETETRILGPKVGSGWRLACQARVMGDVEIWLEEKQAFHTVDAGQASNYPFDPPILSRVAYKETIYGVAIDIGTTSIVASLVDLKNGGKEIGVASCLNPQTQYGGDVITRITFAHQSEENTKKLQSAVIDGINRLIGELVAKTKVDPSDILHMTVAANTTMLHLLVGIDPIPLARAPYNPVFIDYREYKAAELGIKIASDAVVSLLPSLSAFVGADILAGMIAIDYHKETAPSLFVDIGTNGEIVANVKGKLAATSSAAGPALEGMNIHHGCRAEDGAISEVKINEKGEVIVKSIGTAPRKGICGSGLVDLVAELVKSKVILSSGSFAGTADLPPVLGERVIEFQGQKAFLVDPEAGIILTQKDIRQVQLAKAAIAAAIEILFQRLEFDIREVEKIYIAGAFGYHLKPASLKTLGLLPAGLGGHIAFVGNTAKEGARLCLTSKLALEEIVAVQKKINAVELSYAPEFMDNYVQQMNFPD